MTTTTYTVAQVAQMFNRSERTVKRWIQNGQLRREWVGRRLHVTDTTIAQFSRNTNRYFQPALPLEFEESGDVYAD